MNAERLKHLIEFYENYNNMKSEFFDDSKFRDFLRKK